MNSPAKRQEDFIQRVAVRTVAWCLDHRALATLLSLLLIVPAAWWGLVHLKQVDNSLYVWFRADDPSYVTYEAFKEEFGSDQIVAVAFESDDAFSERSLAIQQELVDVFEQVPEIEEVRSILTTDHIKGDESGLVIEPLLEEGVPHTAEERAEARRVALADSTFTGHLISKDGRVAAVLAKIDPSGNEVTRTAVVRSIRTELDVLREKYPDTKIHLSGAPVLDSDFNTLALQDQEAFFPLVFLCTLSVLFGVFRRFSYAFFPTAMQLVVLFSAFGVYFLFRESSNMVVGMVAPILMAACIGDSVHILTRYAALRPRIPDRTERILATVREEARPCFYTSVTTCGGFFSFVTSQVRPVQDLGLLAGFGCLEAYAVTIILIPLGLSFLPHKKRAVVAELAPPVSVREDIGRFGRFLGWLADGTISRPRRVLLLTGGIIVACLIGIQHVKVEANAMEFISIKHPTRQALEFIQNKLTGLHVVEVILETGQENQVKDPGVMKGAEAFQQFMDSQPLVTKSFSPATYLRLINKALHEDNPENERVPDTKEEISQYLLLAEIGGDKEIGKYTDYGYSKLRVSALANAGSSESYGEIVSWVNEGLAKYLPGLKAHITGLIPLYRELDELLVNSQMRSFGTAFVVIFLFLLMLAKNFRLAALGMVPTTLPIFMTGGVMGYLGINLDPATVLIAGIALGIAVDDTVHYLDRFRAEYDASGDWEHSIKVAHRKVGPAIVYTSLILTLGFLVLLAGSFTPTQHFGVLTALTMVFAVIGDLFLLPVLLVFFRPAEARRQETSSSGGGAAAAG